MKLLNICYCCCNYDFVDYPITMTTKCNINLISSFMRWLMAQLRVATAAMNPKLYFCNLFCQIVCTTYITYLPKCSNIIYHILSQYLHKVPAKVLKINYRTCVQTINYRNYLINCVDGDNHLKLLFKKLFCLSYSYLYEELHYYWKFRWWVGPWLFIWLWKLYEINEYQLWDRRLLIKIILNTYSNCTKS